MKLLEYPVWPAKCIPLTLVANQLYWTNLMTVPNYTDKYY